MKILTHSEEGILGYPTGSCVNKAIEFIDNVEPILRKELNGRKFNLWCRGSSGAILATLLAVYFKDDCVISHVKKVGEDSHSPGVYPDKERVNVIIDDFAVSGETVDAINFHVEKYSLTTEILILNRIRCWNFNFVPSVLITDESSSLPDWKHFKPRRKYL